VPDADPALVARQWLSVASDFDSGMGEMSRVRTA